MSLHACPSCRRHVRADESSCPFCGAPIAIAPLPTARVEPRFGRQTAAVLGALGIVVGAACGERARPAVTMYGGPPVVPFREELKGDVDHELEVIRRNAAARGCPIANTETGVVITCDGLEITITREATGMTIECESRRRCEPIVSELRKDVADAGAPSDAAAD